METDTRSGNKEYPVEKNSPKPLVEDVSKEPPSSSTDNKQGKPAVDEGTAEGDEKGKSEEAPGEAAQKQDQEEKMETDQCVAEKPSEAGKGATTESPSEHGETTEESDKD